MHNGTIMVFQGAGKPFQPYIQQLRPLLPGEVLVRNLYTTLCGSDLHTYCGTRQEACPGVLGHEIVGQVIDFSSRTPLIDLRGNPIKKGDIITWSIYASQPDSLFHPKGMPQKAPDLYKYGHQQFTDQDGFHGGLAEYCILKPFTAILKIPENIPIPLAATLNCALATVAGALRLSGQTFHGKRVFISGMGLLGIAATAMLKEEGAAYIIGADRSFDRLSKAKDFGLDELFWVQEGQTPIMDKSMDIALDMSGAPEAMELGIRLLNTGGIAVWVGAVFTQRPLQIEAEQILRKMLTIRGLHNYNYEDFKYAISFLEQHVHHFPFERVIEREFRLEEVDQAFAYALQYQPIRVGINMAYDEK